jgi:hypothetical protein
MSAANTTAAHWGLWRRSRVSVLVAAAAALLALGQTGAVALADQPQPKPPAGQPQPLTPDQQRIENVIAAAKQYLGVPYRVGTEGPSLFDCSGLVFRAFSDAGLVDRIGGARLRAAGYMRLFASRGLMTANESQAQRGDLVIYNNGAHIAIYLGDGRAISALLSGVTVHSVNGISLPVTGFLRPDWSGDGTVPPFVPVTNLPDTPEVPATLVPTADWMPTLNPALTAPAPREGNERVDMRTLNSRTFENADGTFTTELHVQPIFYQPPGTTDKADLQPVNLGFVADPKGSGAAVVTTSPVAIAASSANTATGFVRATAGDYSVSLGLAAGAGMSASKAVPVVLDGGRVVDYFNFQPQSVGLRVLAQTDGFKAFLVLGKVPDRNKFSFTLDSPGLTPVLAEDGSVHLTDADGNTVARIPRPLLLDSSDIDGSGGGVFTSAASLSLSTSRGRPVLTVTVDRSFLEEAVMPAFVDLSLTEFGAAAGADVAFASSAHPNANLHGFQRPESPGYDDLWLGREPGTRSDNQVFLKFDGLSQLLGTVDVASASLELLPYLQQGGGATTVHRATSDWNADALTWSTRPSVDEADAMTVDGAAGAWTSIDVSSYITDVMSRGQLDYGLVLAGDASPKSTWDRLAASDAGANAEFGPRLVVTWSGLRPTAGVASPAAGTTSTTLAWTNPLLSAAQLRFEVQVSRDGFATTDADSGVVKGKAGKMTQWTPPTTELEAGSYQWRVRARYGTDKAFSAWSTAQIIVVIPAHQVLPHSPV